MPQSAYWSNDFVVDDTQPTIRIVHILEGHHSGSSHMDSELGQLATPSCPFDFPVSDTQGLTAGLWLQDNDIPLTK